MIFTIYHIQSLVLRSRVQYILFISNGDDGKQCSFTSFANTNFCLGVCKNIELIHNEDNTFRAKYKEGLHAYLSGIYLNPAKFYVTGMHEEICIDFTPSGYYDFFSFAPKSFINDDCLLKLVFGNSGKAMFERAFIEKDLQLRGYMIETFLVQHIQQASKHFLYSALTIIEKSKSAINVSNLAKNLGCSERKLHRYFTAHLDISPKDYLRVARFRKALHLLDMNTDKTAAIACDLDFADQSHLIREMKAFTGTTPKHLPFSLQNMQNKVWIGID